MRILHVSDTHGHLLPLPRPELWDVMVHSGDLLPTKGRRLGERIRPKAEWMYQLDWVAKRKATLADWCAGKPFVFCPGNHDFYSPIATMRDAGIDAYDVNELPLTLGGISFVGLRSIPFIDGEWIGEIPEIEILAEALDKVGPSTDVLVAHCPPRGLLDTAEDGQHFGSTALARYFGEVLEQSGPEGPLPSLYLCGHIHASPGVRPMLHGTILSNAACTTRVLHVEKRLDRNKVQA